MILLKLVFVGLIFLILCGGAAAQNEKQDRNRITRGMARKMSDVLGNAEIQDSGELTFDELAASVELALANVDPDRISGLNQTKSHLRSREEDLLDQISELEKGEIIPFDFQEDSDPLSPIADVSEESLELEKKQLQARQLRIKELEIQQRKDQAERDAINEAKTMTPLSSALLATLEEVPVLREVPTTVEEAKSEFPRRMARALFKTGDFVGALRHFKLVPEDDMEPRDFYEKARCPEETGSPSQALRVAQELKQRMSGENTFWQARAENLEKLLQTILGQKTGSQDGKDS